MIFAIVRTALTGLRRDRASLALNFVLPIAFFTIFAMVFSGQHDTIPRVHLIVVDQDHSAASRDLVRGLQREGSLQVTTHPEAKQHASIRPDYTASSAEAAVKSGDFPVALIIPAGWGAHPVDFGANEQQGPKLRLLSDQSDPIAPQIVNGLLQKAAMTAMPASMANEGMKYTEEYLGTFTPEQRKRWDENMRYLEQVQQERANEPDANSSSAKSTSSSVFSGGIVAVDTHSVVGEHKNKNLISFYAAAIGVMFLLFTASGAAGSLLDEADSGTLDRVLSSRVTMSALLGGKLAFNTLLAFAQLVVMFLWGWAVFHLDFFTHIPGFLVMGLCTAFAVAAFGILLASMCHTRGQLGAVSTLLILIMSSVGGSMFPRYLMPQAMQKAGLFTINAWAIDGFTKVFWRDLPVISLWPQVGVLLGVGVALFILARRIARRWEFA
ncbi:MAG TPA: ABC transporter permease [Terracidiphilus sp.]|nr:ABC transporter permease [Terracidiphilus sp.]